ncbi:hypothetical protein V2H45_19020 [Tumidithrix elongata RA019]|uniref:Uncharacterized protein n=1 Tax=Tumidithrix elongata BACA0141 TaxID=2716417 RepID=A0AAW9Q5X3_9CYAN|nr:hypothetical protein [Tumidithrix elongata RA019]
MSNIFRLGYIGTEEDYFTASLQYVIENFPNLGQDIVNFLAVQAGKSTTRFFKAIDHPRGNGLNYLDFLLKCEDYDILCEHKLGSSLGELQLERYIRVAESKPKKTYLTLISNGNHSINQSVLNHELYLRPENRSFQHFRWQDIYPLVVKQKKRQNRLIEEFAEFMEYLKMRPPHLVEGWKDLFENPVTAQRLGECWEKVKEFFKTETAAKWQPRSKTRHGMVCWEVSKPNDWLYLLYFDFESNFKQGLMLEYPYIQANIFILEDHPYLNSFRSIEHDIFLCQNDSIGNIEVITAIPEYAGWKRKGDVQAMWVASYFISLNQILDLDLHEVERRLKDFAVSVYEHALKTVEEYTSLQK